MKKIMTFFGVLALCLAFLVPTAMADGPQPGGHTYAVLVGIADYPSSPLPRTDEDAARIARALRAHVPADRLRVQLLLNSDATRSNVNAALSEVARNATEQDEVIVFFSGHGGTENDAATGGDEGDGLDETLVLYDGEMTDDELGAKLRQIKSRFSLVALDSCFSGGFLFDIANARGRMGMFSSSEDLTSAVPADAGGWLSVYLAEALEGRADGAADGVAGQERDGRLTALEIEVYVRERFAVQQRIASSGPESSGNVGYQFIDIKRVAVPPDSVLLDLDGDVSGGVERNVVLEQANVALPGSGGYVAFPRFDLSLEANRSYTIETFGLTGATDTVLELRRATAAAPSERDPMVAENDDNGRSLASQIRFDSGSHAGRYYVRVRPYGPDTGGTFGIRVTAVQDHAAENHTVVLDRSNLSLPGTTEFSSLPAIPMQLVAGHTYVIQTTNLAGSTDTVLELRRQAGSAPAPSDDVLAENDDDGQSLASSVRFTAIQSGTYYAHVRPYGPDTGGSFGLRVTDVDQVTPLAGPR